MDLAMVAGAAFGVLLFVLIEYVDEVVDALVGRDEPFDGTEDA